MMNRGSATVLALAALAVAALSLFPPWVVEVQVRLAPDAYPPAGDIGVLERPIGHRPLWSAPSEDDAPPRRHIDWRTLVGQYALVLSVAAVCLTLARGRGAAPR